MSPVEEAPVRAVERVSPLVGVPVPGWTFYASAWPVWLVVALGIAVGFLLRTL